MQVNFMQQGFSKEPGFLILEYFFVIGTIRTLVSAKGDMDVQVVNTLPIDLLPFVFSESQLVIRIEQPVQQPFFQ